MVRRSIRTTLEAAGAVFTPTNGGGAGVRLRKTLEEKHE
jgi:hypothetical protein